MFKLSDAPSKDEYKSQSGKLVLLGDKEVTVVLNRVDTKSGSWERGFKFGSITYGLLERKVKPTKKNGWVISEFSANHGVTWATSESLAKKAKGKVIIDKPAPRGEFAFDRIQAINKEYDASYKWIP